MQVLQGTAAVADDTSKCNTWVLEASKASGKNMVAFHKAWKFPVTPATEAAVAGLGLPLFQFDATAPCGQECVQCCLPGELSPTISEICRQPLPAGWQFHSYKDSSGSDIGQVVNTNGNWTQLAAACDSSPWCMAVNTNGWMKSALLPQAQWSNSFSDVCKGLLTKVNPAPPALPGLLVNAAMLRLSSLCVEANSSAMVSGTQMILSSCSGNYSQLFRAGSGVNSTRIETVFKTTSGVSLCLGVSSSGTAPGSRVTLQTCGTGASQRWAVDGRGRFLPSHVAGMCLDTEAGSTAAGARLVINACSNAPTQLVVVAAAANCTGSPSYPDSIFSCPAITPSGGTCVGSCTAGNVVTGATSLTATCYNGNFGISGVCLPIGPIAQPSTLQIGGLCINATASSSTRPVLVSCTGANTQLFISGTGSNTRRVQMAYTPTSTAYCLDVSGSGTSSGTAVIMYRCGTGNNQKWTIDSSNRIVAGHTTGKCLDTENGTIVAGTRLVIRTCSTTAPSQQVAIVS
jgi:hypothetical protein